MAWADLLQKAAALFGPDYPAAAQARQQRLDDDEIDDKLDELSRLFLRPRDLGRCGRFVTALLCADG